MTVYDCRGLIHKEVYVCYVLLAYVVSGLCTHRIPRGWISDTGPNGGNALIRQFLESFKRVYTPCHMTYTCHLLLHATQEIKRWSSPCLRWLFVFERLNHFYVLKARVSKRAAMYESLVRHTVNRIRRFPLTLATRNTEVPERQGESVAGDKPPAGSTVMQDGLVGIVEYHPGSSDAFLVPWECRHDSGGTNIMPLFSIS